MKKLYERFLLNRVLLIGTVLCIAFLQSCELMSKKDAEETFKNPYTKKIQQTFTEISDAVFGNIAENLDHMPYGTVSKDDILHYANEGYVNWAKKNDS